MSQVYENSRTALENLIKWNAEKAGSNRNEATTRFHLIDTLLLDCLNWQKSDIQTEDRFDGDYTDYTISLARPTIILEAKREGNYFTLAEGSKGVEYSIDGLCKDNPEFSKAISQACTYCNTRGVEIAIVSNGWQIVAFVANRLDGVAPLKGKAIVFSSLEKMLSNFLEFWNLLSRSGIESKKLKNQLSGQIIPDLPPKLSASIQNYPGIKARNSFQTTLQILSELVLEDVLRYQDMEKIFLEECYCNAGALSNYSAVSKEILRTRYENLFENNSNEIQVTSAVNKSGINQEFKNIAAHSISRRPILLIGDVGVGKSTFINNLIKVEAPEIFDNCLTFKIDLGTKIILTLDIREAIVDEIIRQLREDYSVDIYEQELVNGIYNLDFQRFKKGIYKPYFDANPDKALEKTIEFFEEKQRVKSEHLKSALYYLAKGRKKQIVIFIDNCDQRDYQTQQTAFLISQEIAENWQPVTVFIALRPETFHNSLKKGALSGYLPKAFSIAPPRVDLVIEKRLEFARKIANGEIPLAQFSGNIGINLSTLKDLIEVLIASFNRNPDLHRFIDNICSGNVRLSIDIVKSFLGSGHIDTERIAQIYESRHNYIIQLHDFLKAVILGNNVYYEPHSSYLVNLYDVYYNDPKEHFITSILLSILERSSSSGKDNGFIETSKISTHLQQVGFNIDQIDTAMSLAINRNLIETSARGLTFDKDKLPLSLRITSAGAYHLNSLGHLFNYIDAIIVDTPIFDNDFRDNLNDSFEMEKRLDRAFDFKCYLDNIWLSLEDKQTFMDWNKKSELLAANIQEIRAKLLV